MLLVISLLLALSGFTAICVSMKKHQRDIWKTPLERRSVLAFRALGSVLLALSWAACSAVWGPGMGTVAWVCCAGLAPMVLVFPLAYAPRQSVVAGGLAGVLATCMALIVLVMH